MIKLKITLENGESFQTFDIEDNEILDIALDRVFKDLPFNGADPKEYFNVVVNGYLIERDFYKFTHLKESDICNITPKIMGGDFGQIFSQIAVIVVTVVASIYLSPAVGGGIAGALAVAGASIATTLLLNALIPPPSPDLGGAFGRTSDSSQMYSITGQSNSIKQFASVPQSYGTVRMFPNIACKPYTELSVDPLTGKTIQYYYCVYDFGMGTYQLTDLQIGDTPLTIDSFEDFSYNFVDTNLPIPDDQDIFDQGLAKEFKLYKGVRTLAPLSVALNSDGDENIQVADTDTSAIPLEIVLDFVCPIGLFAYDSNGNFIERDIQLEVMFALDGTDDWKAYNDLNEVSSYTQIGGKDTSSFNLKYKALDYAHPDMATYYDAVPSTSTIGSNYSNGTTVVYNNYINFNPKAGQPKLLLENNPVALAPGTKIYYTATGIQSFLGIIQSVTAYDAETTEVTLDRNIIFQGEFFYDGFGILLSVSSPAIPAYQQKATRTQVSINKDGTNPVYTYDPIGDPFNIISAYLNGHTFATAIIQGNSQNPVYASLRFTPKNPGTYKVRVRRIVTIGSVGYQKEDNLSWVQLTTNFSNTPINTTKRHLFMELKIRATDQLNGNIQNLSAVITSVLPTYDTDTDTWIRQPTSNPAWVFADLLTGQCNKRPLDKSKLHLPSLLDWAAYCQTIPTPPPDKTYLDPRFQCNFILDYQATLQDVIASVTGMAQAQMNLIDGKYGVFIDQEQDTPVQIFTPRNSTNFSSSRAYSNKPDGVKVNYIDPNTGWQTNTIVAYDNGFTGENAVNLDDLTAFACTNAEQAWRFGRYMIAQNRYRQETISITVDFENLVCTRGDYVQITQDVMRVGGRPARVKFVTGNQVTVDDAMLFDITLDYGYVYRATDTGEINTSTLTIIDDRNFTVDGDIPEIGDLIVVGEIGKIVFDCIVKTITPNDDLSATLVLVERAIEIYDYESTDIFPDYDPEISQTSDPNTAPPAAVTNLQITDNFYACNQAGTGYDYFIELLWDIPQGAVYQLFEIWVNVDNLGFKVAGTTTNKLYRYVVTSDEIGQLHQFKVVAVSANGNKINLIDMPEVETTPEPKTIPPSDIENFVMQITNQVLQLTWDKIPDCDCKEYQIRFSPDENDLWESSVTLMTVDKNTSTVSVQCRTGVYLIKAFDYNGNQSAGAAESFTTIPNLFDITEITEIDEAPDYDGTLTDTEKLGDAVILTEQTPGDVDTVVYSPLGYYEFVELVDLDDIFSVRLQSNLRAEGFKKDELMSSWIHLSDVLHLSDVTTDQWDVALQYRASETFSSIADWAHLSEVDHVNFGAGIGFTDWRDIPTIGDATGRIFQFRARLESLAPNVSPRLVDSLVKVFMANRVDSFENMVSSASESFEVDYNPVFKGPDDSPNIQISLHNGLSGDYYTFDFKTLEGFAIRFYDSTNTQVSRTFDAVVSGFGYKHSQTL